MTVPRTAALMAALPLLLVLAAPPAAATGTAAAAAHAAGPDPGQAALRIAARRGFVMGTLARAALDLCGPVPAGVADLGAQGVFEWRGEADRDWIADRARHHAAATDAALDALAARDAAAAGRLRAELAAVDPAIAARRPEAALAAFRRSHRVAVAACAFERASLEMADEATPAARTAATP